MVVLRLTLSDAIGFKGKRSIMQGKGYEGHVMKKTKPSDLELQVLSLLWELGNATVREVLDAMPDGKKRAYTTMLSVLQVMEKKGLVTHESKGQSYSYKPTVKRSQILKPVLRNLVDNVFGGSPASVFQSLVSETSINADELNQIQKLVDELKKSRKGSTKQG